MWFDHGIGPEFLASLQGFQRVNHFLGMYNISRKNTLGIHLKRFQKLFPEDFDFFPKTWLYPSDYHDIQEYFKQK
jgi:tubulin polyglutamylase TTLL6/13